MSKIFVDQVDPKTGTSLTLGTSGDTVNIPSGVTLANAGTMTGVPASAISSGTIATARLGSGTASSSTFLRGDQTYAAAGGANTPSFQAKNSSRTSVANNVDTKIAYTSEDYDLGGDYDASNSRFTPQTAGKYYVYHSGGFNSGDDFEPVRLAIWKNGGLLIENQYRNLYYNVNYVATVVTMNGSSDYVEAFGKQASGSTIDFDNNNNTRAKFGAFKVIE